MSFADWLAGNGLDITGTLTQSQFAVNYTAWLNYLVNDFLKDLFDLDGGEDGIIEVGLNQNDPNGTPQIEGISQEDLNEIFGATTVKNLVTGKTTQDRYFSDLNDDFDWGGGDPTVTSNDGHDTITGFAFGQDVLDFSGLSGFTAAQFDEFFAVTDDGSNTEITIDGDTTWSVTIVGVDGHTEGEWYNQIDFS